ncbi:MAG TPA: N-acetylmuramoyl-L-alanine amidase [Tepidisphaeraceae bacterium]|jgi:hypothetical protein|nr:N-acetylmuramoyl-L-alanine amidase [Tepidisphaeraceae bacterium]
MRKHPAKPFFTPWLVSFSWLAVLAGLAGASYWAWQRGHQPPATVGIYHEPGWMPEHKSNRWTCIVIHHSACERGAAESFDEAHRKRGWDGLGYDFVIGNGSESGDGEVEVGFRWVRQIQGAHCKTDDQYYNEHGIGICLVGNLDNHPPDEKQLQSLVRLVDFLCAEFKIPPTEIYTHGGITGKTACPGKDFNLAQLKQLVRRDAR